MIERLAIIWVIIISAIVVALGHYALWLALYEIYKDFRNKLRRK